MKTLKNVLLAVTAAGATVLTANALVFQDGDDPMAAYEEVMHLYVPGPMHEAMQALVGSWTVTGKWRMGADGEWMEFTHAVERRMLYENRHLEETLSGDWMGVPFEGRGTLSYDNVSERYTSCWLENMTTGVAISHGTASEDGKVIALEGTHSDATATDKQQWFKTVLTIESDDRQSNVMYGKDENGREFETMRSVYERKK